jgi:hypothetical protein
VIKLNQINSVQACKSMLMYKLSWNLGFLSQSHANYKDKKINSVQACKSMLMYKLSWNLGFLSQSHANYKDKKSIP